MSESKLITGKSTIADSAGHVHHIVLVAVKENLSNDQINDMLNGVYSLSAIKGVVSVTVGANIPENSRADGYTHGFDIVLDSKESLVSYAVDPLHVDVKEKYIKPIISKIMAIDIQI